MFENYINELLKNLPKRQYNLYVVIEGGDFNGYYVYDNPQDNRYISDVYFQAVPGFFTGGQEKSHSKRYTMDRNIKMDANWQMNYHHNIKAGIDILLHNII